MNFPRIVILVMLIASAVLGWFLFKETQRLEAVEKGLDETPVLANKIQKLGYQLQGLYDVRSKEGLVELDKPEYYIQSVATDPKIRIGQVNITPREKAVRGVKGVIDKNFQIRATSKGDTFSRSQIGNFLYQLEAKSRRIRVTDFSMKAAGKKLSAGQVGNDQWEFDATVTSRETEEG